MHREALADLGESLRRELQDLWHDDPLADMAGDAERLLETLDREMQALSVWLTSPSVSVDLPPDASPAPEGADPVRQRSWRSEAVRASAAPAEHLPMSGGGNPSIMEQAALSTEPKSDAVPLSALPEKKGFYPIGRGPDPHGRQMAPPDGRAPASDSPRDESKETRRAASHRDAPAMRVETLRSEADTRDFAPPEAGVPPLSARSAYSPAKNLRQRPEPATRVRIQRDELDPGEFAPRETGVPPPSERSAFIPVKNLRDLARLLSGEDGAASRPLNPALATTSEEVGSDEAAGLLPGGERLVWSPTAITVREDEPPPPAALLRRAPAQPPFIKRESRARQDSLTGASQAGEMAAASPQKDAAEVDVESLLDALTQSVAEDYKRFYGG